MPKLPDLAGGKEAKPASMKAAAKALAVGAKEELGMQRWLRVTARKALTSPKSLGNSGNAAADAAAEAIAELLKEAKKLA